MKPFIRSKFSIVIAILISVIMGSCMITRSPEMLTDMQIATSAIQRDSITEIYESRFGDKIFISLDNQPMSAKKTVVFLQWMGDDNYAESYVSNLVHVSTQPTCKQYIPGVECTSTNFIETYVKYKDDNVRSGPQEYYVFTIDRSTNMILTLLHIDKDLTRSMLYTSSPSNFKNYQKEELNEKRL